MMLFLKQLNNSRMVGSGFALILGAVLLTGCASSDPMDSDRPRESSIPWNKPESWEGPGVLGSAMPGAGSQ